MHSLERITDQGAERIQVPKGTSVLGRSHDAPLHIPDPSLSRRHAEVWSDGREASVRDLGSHNGTRVNGVTIAGTARLKDGDTLLCGDVSLRLCFEAAPQRSAPIPPQFSAAVAGPHPTHTIALRRGSSESAAPAERRLATLLRVSALLAQPGTIEVLQQRTLDLAADILPIDQAVLVGVDDDGALSLLATRGGKSDSDQKYSESIVRFVLENRVAAKFDDAVDDQRLGGAESLVAQSIRCAMCAPLISEDKVLGVLYVDNRLSTHLFESNDLELLAGFANQAASAMHNANLRERLERAAVQQNTLERFFPPATATRLLESGGDLGVRELFVTALFSDISAFTAMSATMAPAKVVALLHRYFPPMAQIVFERDGTLEKYIGDALLAVWGAPFGHPDDADRALEAAVAMHEAVIRMRPSLSHPINIHIGLHSGVVALANIGSEDYLQVATIGDATNTSARVCSSADDGQIVISRATADQLTRCAWPLTALPPTRVKGKAEPLELYRVEWT